MGDSGVAGEGRVVGVPKFHSWGKCTMPLTNINSDWMSNGSSGLRIILYYAGPFASWGVTSTPMFNMNIGYGELGAEDGQV